MSGTISMSSDDAVPQRVSQWRFTTEAELNAGLLVSLQNCVHFENSNVYVCFVPLPEKLLAHPDSSLLQTTNSNPVDAVAVKTIRSKRLKSMSGLSAANVNPTPALPTLIEAGSAVRDACALEADGGATHAAVVDRCV
jgi:hypothetical protein